MAINLLPEEYKNRIKNQKKWNSFLSLEMIILFLCIFTTLGIVGIKIYFNTEDKYQISILEAYKNKNIASQAMVLEIKDVNSQIKRINAIFSNQQKPFDYFIKTAGNLEKGMSLKSFSYKLKDNSVEITLAGYAPNNDVLSKFEDNLENVFNTSIIVPLDALAKRNDIDFSFSFSISTNKDDNK